MTWCLGASVLPLLTLPTILGKLDALLILHPIDPDASNFHFENLPSTTAFAKLRSACPTRNALSAGPARFLPSPMGVTVSRSEVCEASMTVNTLSLGSLWGSKTASFGLVETRWSWNRLTVVPAAIGYEGKASFFGFAGFGQAWIGWSP